MAFEGIKVPKKWDSRPNFGQMAEEKTAYDEPKEVRYDGYEEDIQKSKEENYKEG